jgi:hypothetical protein
MLTLLRTSLIDNVIPQKQAHKKVVVHLLGHRRLSTTGIDLTPSEDEVRAAVERAGLSTSKIFCLFYSFSLYPILHVSQRWVWLAPYGRERSLAREPVR